MGRFSSWFLPKHEPHEPLQRGSVRAPSAPLPRLQIGLLRAREQQQAAPALAAHGGARGARAVRNRPLHRDQQDAVVPHTNLPTFRKSALNDLPHFVCNVGEKTGLCLFAGNEK